MPMQMVLRVVDVIYSSRAVLPTPVAELTWRFDPAEDRPCAFDVWSESGRSFWANNDVRDQLGCVVVGADRRLAYQLSYTSKWTLLSRLMRRFHERLIEDEDRVDRLRDRFAEVVAIFHEVAEFQAFSTELQTVAGEFAANMRYGLEMDFSAYDPSNYFRSLRVHPTSDGEVRSFDAPLTHHAFMQLPSGRHFEPGRSRPQPSSPPSHLMLSGARAPGKHR